MRGIDCAQKITEAKQKLTELFNGLKGSSGNSNITESFEKIRKMITELISKISDSVSGGVSGIIASVFGSGALC